MAWKHFVGSDFFQRCLVFMHNKYSISGEKLPPEARFQMDVTWKHLPKVLPYKFIFQRRGTVMIVRVRHRSRGRVLSLSTQRPRPKQKKVTYENFFVTSTSSNLNRDCTIWLEWMEILSYHAGGLLYRSRWGNFFTRGLVVLFHRPVHVQILSLSDVQVPRDRDNLLVSMTSPFKTVTDTLHPTSRIHHKYSRTAV